MLVFRCERITTVQLNQYMHFILLTMLLFINSSGISKGWYACFQIFLVNVVSMNLSATWQWTAISWVGTINWATVGDGEGSVVLAQVRNIPKMSTPRIYLSEGHFVSVYVAIVRTNSHCKEDVVGHVQHSISMIGSMVLSLSYCANIFATGKRVSHGGEYRLWIPVNFHFHVPEEAIKLPKR